MSYLQDVAVEVPDHPASEVRFFLYCTLFFSTELYELNMNFPEKECP